MIGSNGVQSSSATSKIQRELERRWAEFSSLGTKKMLISKNRQWIALPLRGEKKAITAVFLGWHLSAIAVVRSRTGKFAERLLVIDEQKRIASEIHDSISQNLFSIVYSIDALARGTGHTLDKIQQEALQDVKNLSAETARELRALIYRLNPCRDVNDTFINQIAEYLDKMARMNKIQIRRTVNCSAEHLNPAISKSLYRIIKESTANALRHGNCSEILV